MAGIDSLLPEQPKPRGWQLHLSTAVVLTLVTGTLIGLNCVPDVQPNERSYGWPIPVINYLGELPPTLRSGWPLWFDIISNLLIVAYSGALWEVWMTRRVSRRRGWTRTATSLFSAALATLVVCFLNFYPRPPQAPVTGKLYGWPLVTVRAIAFEYVGPVRDWENIHRDQRDLIERELGAKPEATVGIDAATQTVHVSMKPGAGTNLNGVSTRVNQVTALLLIVGAWLAAEWFANRRSAKERMD